MSGSSTASPVVAARLRRPSWRDPRLLVGVLLVLASVALASRLIAEADRTVPVYAARDALSPGTTLSSDVLAVVRVRLAGTDAVYLDAREPVPRGRVLLRSLGAGEIVPESSTGLASALLTRPVTVPLEGPASNALVKGSLADVWASPRRRDTGASTGYGEPRRIARAVEVSDVVRPGEGLAAGRSASVEVLLDETELPLVLDALANEARTAVVPVPGSGGEEEAP
jgi:hypothetical protein